jgi:hypothetical protein
MKNQESINVNKNKLKEKNNREAHRKTDSPRVGAVKHFH